MSGVKASRDIVLRKIKGQLSEHEKCRPDDDHEEKEDWEIWGKRFVELWVSLFSFSSRLALCLTLV
jgi:hypothetical protein